MAEPTPSHTVGVTIAATPATVYDYLLDPRNLPAWAAGLAKAVYYRNGQWVVDSGDGEWIVQYVERNALGVADHLVTLPDGTKQLNPMRVLTNGDGAEVLFTLFRAEAADEEAWQTLISTITADLETLRDLFGAKA